MKMKAYFFVVFFVMSLTFISCKEDPILTISTTNYSVANEGGIVNVSVTTNQTLEVLISPDQKKWISSTFDPQNAVSIDGVLQIPFSFEKSNEYETRSADITISGGGLSCLLTFTQQGCKILQAENEDIFIPFEGKSVSMSILHNMDYEIQISDETWIKQSLTRGVNESSLQFDVLPNETYDFRYGYIELKDIKSSYVQKINITQGSTPYLSLDKGSAEFDVDGGILSLEVISNIPYSIDISADWISETPTTRGLSSENHEFVIRPLEIEEFMKSGHIDIYNDSLKIKKSVVITQKFEPEKVDLGLPSGTKWASTNLGTCKPFGFGYFLAWGETSSKDFYSDTNYAFGTSVTFDQLREKGIIDIRGNLVSEYDMSTCLLGEGWHTPTVYQIQELQNTNYTKITTAEMEGVAGIKITSKKNGNSIFLPYAGYSYESEVEYKSQGGFYWTSTYSKDRINRANYYLFGDVSGYWSSVYTGYKVRPVSK